jgi:serine/threonine protein kinase
MGVVFAGRDVALDREVAVKRLRPDHSAGPEVVRRFLEEAKITARLQHPGIPAVHEVGTLPDGRPFLAMKLIKGERLAALVKGQGHGGGKWVGVFEAVCQAVGAAHANGIIHRDLKPANVMVGAFGEVQVMDWGLAKVPETAEAEEEMVEATRLDP